METEKSNSCIRGCCKSDKIPLTLDPKTFTLLNPIAKGSESIVYKALLNGVVVAVKKPVLATSSDIDMFHKQLQMLCEVEHVGIAKFVAAHAKPPGYMYVFEYYKGGSLGDKIHGEEWSPEIGLAVEIIVQIAKALQYLHNHGIAHRDVKPANILLDSKMCPHIADFGLAEYKKDLKNVTFENWRSSGKPTGGFHKKNMVGTLIYMAPEVLKKEVQTEKSDVYSFGISINELLTGVVPYTDLRTETQAHTVLEMNYTEQQLTAAITSEGLRPALVCPESGVPASVVSLIQRCWDSNSQNRPSFDDIITELDPIIRSVKKDRGEMGIPVEPSVGNDLRTFQESINWFNKGELLSKEARATDSYLKVMSPSSNNVMLYHPTISSGSFATCGRRETMEDMHFLMPHMCNEKDIHFFGIFDGHRGSAAAEFSAQALPGFFQTLVSTRSPAVALSEAFVKTDLTFRDELISQRNLRGAVRKDWHPGCTAVTALIIDEKLFVANAGDCRTILCRGGNSIALSKDHVASRLDERDRVTEAGGLVKWQVDTWRVGAAALQVTRSIGDDDLKPFVTAEPEITETTLTSEDEYLVMASDGLWDVIKNEEVIAIIRDTVKEPGMCSKRLATEAAERGSKDNITVIVVFLRPVSTAERIY